MYFKRLEVYGFKSFVDKTTLIFESGVTAIVGPNGTGKSNIADAIKWVLGEQSAKSMRGSKMEDVIFNGTESRPPVNMAEVSLTLSNEGRHLPLEYDEVTITRRLYRSGESEYLLNKTLVRLKDIQELLMGTGIGTEAYSLLEQGRIDTIISSKPEDRREVFEEASGITRYKKKKNEAIRKLDQTQENLLRVNDIVTEVTRQVHSIERQVSKARRYQEHFELLKTLELQHGYKEYLELVGQRQLIQEETAALHQQQAAREQDLARLAETFEQFRHSLAQAEAAHATSQEQLMGLNAQKEKHSDRLHLNRERIAEYAQREETLRGEIDQGRVRSEHLEAELAQIEERLRVFADEKDRKQEQWDLKQSAWEEVEKEIGRLQGQIAEEKNRAVTLLADHAQQRNELTKLSAHIHNLTLRLQRLHQEQEKTRGEAAAVAARLDHTAQEVQQLQGGVQAKGDQERQLRHELEHLTTTLSQLEAEIQRAQQSLVARQSQVGVLEQLHKTYEGFDAPVRELMRHRDQHPEKFTGVHDVLVNLIEVSPGYELCVETALADVLQAVLVETAADALRMHLFADERGIGRVRFLIRNAISEIPAVDAGQGLAVCADALSGRIECHPRFRPVIDYFLRGVFVARGDSVDAAVAHGVSPDERQQEVRFSYHAPADSHVAVVGDFNSWQISQECVLRYQGENLWETALWMRPGRYCYKFVVNNEWVTDSQNPELEIDVHGNLNSVCVVGAPAEAPPAVAALPTQFAPGERLVIREGNLYSAVECVSRPAVAQQSGLIAQKARVRELRTQCARIAEVIAQYTHQEEEKRTQQSAIRDSLARVSRMLNDEKLILANRDSERSGIESEKKKLEDELCLMEVEIQETVLDEQDLRRQEKAGQEQLAEVEAQIQRGETVLAAVQAQGQDASRRREVLMVEIAELKTQNALLAEQEESMLANKMMRARARDEVQAARSENERQRDEVTQRAEALTVQNEELEQEIERVTRAHAAAEEAWRHHSEQRVRILAEFDSAQQEIRRQEQVLNDVKNKSRDEEVRALETGFKIDALVAGMQQNYKIDLADARVELPPDIDWSAHARHIEELKTKLDRLGAVNLAAVDEEKELRERLEFLTTQRQDLLTAKETLMQTIQKINRTTRSLFLETFEKSKVAFREYFRMLFGGGDAQLHLVEEADILESGIDIVVRPPGKRLQSITLLSGGERTLTAIALLFALFKIKPSPFCVLDEMDAPLDESNVDRFTRVLQEFLKTSQFIIITHNKKTIAMADVMYGVTMQDPGISRLVSVKFSEYKDTSPPEAVAQAMAAAADAVPQETALR